MQGAQQERLLRIGVVHNNQVIEERFVRGQGNLMVGRDRGNVIVLPGADSPASVKLFESRGATYALCFGKQSGGRVDLGNGPESLDALIESGRAKKKGDQWTVDLPDTARGRVTFGSVVVLFQVVEAPQVDAKVPLVTLARNGLLYRMDWPAKYIFGAIFLLFGGSAVTADVWWELTGKYFWHPFGEEAEVYGALRVEVAQKKPEKKPVKAVVDTKPIDTFKTPEAKKEEKAAAEKAAPDKNKGSSVASRESRRTKMTAEVRQKTFLSGLGGGAGDGTRKAINDPSLAGAFESFGDGTAMGPGTGQGPGAGGPQAAGDGGARYKTLTAGEVGGGRLATSNVKTEEKTADSEVKVKAHVRDGSLTGQQGTGKIDKDAVAKVFARRKNAIQYCYEKALQRDSTVHGKIAIRFTIGPAGRITAISATENSTGVPAIADCIIDKVQSWRFDPVEGGSVTFNYPFVLDAK